jgi:tetratricopeptide (TPR) repeat protein
VLELELPRPGDGVGRVALQSLGVAAALGALCTLFPYRSQGNPSDGLGVLSSWFASAQSFSERLAWPFLEEARRHLLREQLTLAEQTLSAGLAHHPGEPRLAGLLAVCRAAAGDAEGAYAALEALGPPDERPVATRAELLADAAWSVLCARDAPLLPEAERALERAIELSPGDLHHEILLGRVLLERGRPENAYARLMSAYKRTRDVDQEAQCVAYLVLACQALGGLTDTQRVASYATRFEAAVRSHDVPPALRQRALERASQARR